LTRKKIERAAAFIRWSASQKDLLSSKKNIGQAAAIKELQQIPGVGPSIAEDLWNIGLRAVSDLKGRDPEELYRRSCRYEGKKMDRCLLYVYRCAIYFASNEKHRPELLNWWAWKE
jgi:hypothetical protein